MRKRTLEELTGRDGITLTERRTDLANSMQRVKDLSSIKGVPTQTQNKFKDKLDNQSVLMFCLTGDDVGSLHEVTINATFENRGYFVEYRQDSFQLIPDANAMNAPAEVRLRDLQRVHGALVDAGCHDMFGVYGTALDMRKKECFNVSGSISIVPYERPTTIRLVGAKKLKVKKSIGKK